MEPDHSTFMKAALEYAQGALDNGEFPVGCVIVNNGKIIGGGARRNSKGDSENEVDHAEIVVLRDILDSGEEHDLSGAVLYSTMEPCLMCYATMILSGIRNIVYGYEDVMSGGCSLDLASLPPLYAGMNVTITPGVEREKCLEMFKKFFDDAENEYWNDSLLSQYTLDQ